MSSDRRQPQLVRAAATLVLPKTGERVYRDFSLSVAPGNNEETPLIDYERASLHTRYVISQSFECAREHLRRGWRVVNSPAGQAIFKCSLAYAISSLATFIPRLSDFLGHNDGKHVVATVSVYFHPARSAGSMLEATLLALCAFLYTAIISLISMAISIFFKAHDLLVVGHAIVLVVFCGGALGLIGWTKQKMGNPLVNVACSLASLTLISVLTREDSVQSARFSFDKIFLVLKMVFMGVVISATISFTVWPRPARKELRKDFIRVTDLLEEILTAVTKGFLSGSADDLDNKAFRAAQRGYDASFKALVKDLREARIEHYVLGTVREHELEIKLVKCIERLAQSLFGLRSAASTQFQLLQKEQNQMSIPMVPQYSLVMSPAPNDNIQHGILNLTDNAHSLDNRGKAIEQDHEQGSKDVSHRQASAHGLADIFAMFIDQLGPSIKSLTFTLNGVLHELPFGPAPNYDVTFDTNFRTSLEDAQSLYITARKKCLNQLYKDRVWARDRSFLVSVDYEEVAASCGQFSSSLQDFAEDTLRYLEILENLEQQLQGRRRRSWYWLLFWRRKHKMNKYPHDSENLLQNGHDGTTSKVYGPVDKAVPQTSPFKKVREQKVAKNLNDQLRSVRIWKTLAPLRRDDIKYAIKVGTGAVFYALLSFLPETRPMYVHWRGEWGLLSYMLVCSMTIGASNTTGFHRFLGTCTGAILAVLFWILAAENALALGFFGWLMSVGCFYIILKQGRGPMGRFILLTYNLSALYAYSLSIKEGENDDDEGGISPEIWDIVLHRVVSVMAGCLWGVLITRVIWPISARRKVRHGIATLWLRMGLIWKRDPLQVLVDGPAGNTYIELGESIELQRYLTHLQVLRSSASHEFDLRGPFQDVLFQKMLEATSRILGSYHAMHVVIQKDLKASSGEAKLLRMTSEERLQLSARISHLFSVLASSMKLEYPMNTSVPSIENSRARFLSKLFTCRKTDSAHSVVNDGDYEVLYAYGQIAGEIETIFATIEQLYGVLHEESLMLR